MARLYPPITEEVLSAFCLTYNDKQEKVGASITINFNLNRAVAISEISGIALRLRTISTNQYIITENINKNDEINKSEGYALSYDLDTGTAIFQITNTYNSEKMKFLNVGQYYKAQIAFIDLEGNIGYWSTVSTIKCVAKPYVSIANFIASDANVFMNEIIGEYVQDTVTGDSSEKVYSYRFQLWDAEDNIIEDTGIQLHNSSADISGNSSTDIYYCYKNLNEDEIYYIEYSITTINGLQISSPRYQIINVASINPEKDIILVAQNGLEENFIQNKTWAPWEEGVIKLYIDFKDHNDNSKTLTGNFVILRSSSKDNFGSWQEIRRFRLTEAIPSNKIIYDYTVEQGINYRYAIQQFNKQGFYSKKIYSYVLDENGDIVYNNDEPVINTIKADFEDMFLYDGERQLKIRFNPKVNSFKNDLQEQKIDTIGSKHPFIFRNGNVLYKEFPISGLLSFQLDNANFFITNKDYEQMDLARFEIPSDQLSLRYRMDETSYTYVQITSSREITRQNYNSLYTQENKNINLYEDYGNHENLLNSTIVDTQNKISYKPINSYEEAYQLYRAGEKIYKKISTVNNLEGYKDIYRGIVYNKNDLTSDNIASERYFKLLVLDWLTDGKPKLFRSPTEGNYIVRLLNVNLSPKTELGRMLHEFSCTAYEIADFNYNSLVDLGLLSITDVQPKEYQWISYNIKDLFNSTLTSADSNGDQYYSIYFGEKELCGFSCTGFAPGDKIKIVIEGQTDPIIITIGQSGSYIYEDSKNIISLGIMPQNNTEDFPRSFLLAVKGYITQGFDTIASISTHTEIGEQFIGQHNNIFKNMIVGENGFEKAKNLNLTENGGEKLKVVELLHLHAKKREIIPIFLTTEGNYNYDLDIDTSINRARFSLTPFGNGYIQYETEIKTIGTKFDTDINKLWIKLSNEERTQMRTIKNLVEFVKTENKLYLDNFCLFEVYVPLNNNTSIIWVPYFQSKSNCNVRGIFDPYLYEKEMKEHPNPFAGWWRQEIEEQYGFDYDPSFSLVYKNDNTDEEYTREISLQNTNEITLQNIKTPILLSMKNGVVIELIYRMQTIDYGIEKENNEVKSLKNIYLETQADALQKIALYRTQQYSKQAGQILYDKYNELAAEINDYSNYSTVIFNLTEQAQNQQSDIIHTYLLNESNLVTNILLRLQSIDLDLKESLGEEYQSSYSFYNNILQTPKEAYNNQLSLWLNLPIDELLPSVNYYIQNNTTSQEGYNDVMNKVSNYLQHILKSNIYNFFSLIDQIKNNMQQGYNNLTDAITEIGTNQYVSQYLDFLQEKGSSILLSDIMPFTFFEEENESPIGEWINLQPITNLSINTDITSDIWSNYFHLEDDNILQTLENPQIEDGVYKIKNLDKYISIQSNNTNTGYNYNIISSFCNPNSLLFTKKNNENKTIIDLIVDSLWEINSNGIITEEDYENTWGIEFNKRPVPAGLELYTGNQFGMVDLGLIPSNLIISKSWLETIIDSGFIEDSLFNGVTNDIEEDGSFSSTNKINSFLNNYNRYNSLPPRLQQLLCESIYYYLLPEIDGKSMRDIYQQAYTVYAYWQSYKDELSVDQISIIKNQITNYNNLIMSSDIYNHLYNNTTGLISTFQTLLESWYKHYNILFGESEGEDSLLKQIKNYINIFNDIIVKKQIAIDKFKETRMTAITLKNDQSITVSDNIKTILWEKRKSYYEAYEQINQIQELFTNQYNYIQSLAQYSAYADFLKSYLSIIFTNPYSLTMAECQQYLQQALAMRDAGLNEEYNPNNQQKRIDNAWKNFLITLSDVYQTEIEGRFIT